MSRLLNIDTLNAAPARVTRKSTSAKLQPKEHGAYAILAVPIVTALLIAGPTAVGFTVAVASVAGFLAHEPLLVAWGHRGGRAQAATPTATRRLLLLLGTAIACGMLAMVLGGHWVRWSLVGCLLLATTSFLLALGGKHRTMGGQLWGVIGLSVPCVPILLAGGLSTHQALSIWLAWLIGFTSTTAAVRGVIAAQKRKPRTIHWMLVTAMSASVCAATIVGAAATLCALPMIVISWGLLFWPPPASQIRRVGWTLVAGSVTSAVWLIVSH